MIGVGGRVDSCCTRSAGPARRQQPATRHRHRCLGQRHPGQHQPAPDGRRERGDRHHRVDEPAAGRVRHHRIRIHGAQPHGENRPHRSARRRSGAASRAPSPPGAPSPLRCGETRPGSWPSPPARTRSPPPCRRGAATPLPAITRASPGIRCTATGVGTAPPTRAGRATAAAWPVPSPLAHRRMPGSSTHRPPACTRLDRHLLLR